MIANDDTDPEIHTTTDALTLEEYTVQQTRKEVQLMIDGGRQKGFGDAVSTERRISVSSFRGFQKDRTGKPICNHSNIVALLTKHPDWNNVFVIDAFDQVKSA